MLCSTIIPTVGRSSLGRAVASVLEQDVPAAEFEVIVVNDTGRPLPSAVWQGSDQVRSLTTRRRERCVARNAGAALARGKFLHFLDDDDWLLPGAFPALFALAEKRPGAGWYYGGAQLRDRAGRRLIELHPRLQENAFLQVMAGEWLPLQASLLRSDAFFVVGGFHPMAVGVEDVDLARRMTLRHDVAGCAQVAASIGMGEAESTTNKAEAAVAGRMTREEILDAPGAFARMRDGAGAAYWRGRVTRAYATSAVWNARRGNLIRAAGRLGRALWSLGWSGTAVAGRDYWRAVLRPYRSFAFARGREEAGA